MLSQNDFEKLKRELFMCGTDAIDDFLGFECTETDKDVIDHMMDDIAGQMPDDILQEFYDKYCAKTSEIQDIKVIPLTEAERNYVYSHIPVLDEKTGRIGHLRGDFGSNGKSFFTGWFNHDVDLNTGDFRKSLDYVIDELRSNKHGLLKNLDAMEKYVAAVPESRWMGYCYPLYGFRVDYGQYTFLFRCNTCKGDYNFYCYCYIKERLSSHMEKAAKGITFYDEEGNEIFHIPNCGRIILHMTNPERPKCEVDCQFIDYDRVHINGETYDMRHFHETMKSRGWEYEPLHLDKKYDNNSHANFGGF